MIEGLNGMTTLFLLLLIGLELKHYVADYFLQPSWMLAGKGDWRMPGGYAHAGVHAAFTSAVLLILSTPLSLVAAIFAGEFVVHYLLDFAKIRYSQGVHMTTQPRRFWILHGIDQITHQLTYAGIIYIVLSARGLG